jgi:predicted transcriptional regulator
MPATKKSSSSKKRSSGRKYGSKAQADVKKEMHEYKRGKARSGPGGKGGKVKSRKQAIAIGLSKARKEGAKVPNKKAA